MADTVEPTTTSKFATPSDIPGMDQALERMKPSNWPGEPTLMQSIGNELLGQLQRVVLPTQEVLKNATILFQSPLALATAVPLVENLRINRAMSELASIPEGKTLVDAAVGTKVKLNPDPRYSGGSNCFFTSYSNGKVRMGSNGISVNGYTTHGQMLTTLIHELHHERQLKGGVMKSLSDKVPSPVEQVWYERAMEADAQATATDISWKLKEAGKPAAWNALKTDGHWRGQVANAYEKKANSDPKAVANGTAKRAAFDTWFSATNKFGVTTPMIYNKQATNNLPGIMDFQELHRAGLPFEPMKAKDVEKLGDIAPQNYLKAPGGKPLDDVSYRAADFNQWQAARLNFLHTKYDEIKQGNYPQPNLAHPSITPQAAPSLKQQATPVAQTPAISLARRPGGMKI